MLLPPPVRAPAIAWLTAVAAGVGETLVHLADPEPPSPAALAARGLIYALVVGLVLALRTGLAAVRWALAILLGGVGTASLLVEPVSWLAAGGSPAAYLAGADTSQWAVVALRAVHVAAVLLALILMFRPRVTAFVRARRAGCAPRARRAASAVDAS